MSTHEEIAREISGYLQQGAMSQQEFVASHSGELEHAQGQVRSMAREHPEQPAETRGLGETATSAAQSAGGLVAWAWKQVEPVVRQQICSPENYKQLQSITAEQLAAHVDDILIPLAASVTSGLPAVLRFLVPVVGVLRKLVANIIAAQLQQAARTGWAQYCGITA